ncbi:hypothetical protein VTN96DRAFT_6704 [Rasamsonia emersonii]
MTAQDPASWTTAFGVDGKSELELAVHAASDVTWNSFVFYSSHMASTPRGCWMEEKDAGIRDWTWRCRKLVKQQPGAEKAARLLGLCSRNGKSGGVLSLQPIRCLGPWQITQRHCAS